MSFKGMYIMNCTSSYESKVIFNPFIARKIKKIREISSADVICCIFLLTQQMIFKLQVESSSPEQSDLHPDIL